MMLTGFDAIIKKKREKNQIDSIKNDKATRLQLYVRDRQLLKELKLAAVEEEKSISQLFEEWATRWLEERS